MANTAIEVYAPERTEVERHMRKWGIHEPSMYQKCREWYLRCSNEKWFARGVEFPGVYNGEAGTYLAVSNGESNRAAAMYDHSFIAGFDNGVSAPEYLFFTVYFFVGRVFLNTHGFCSKQYPMHDLGRFDAMLQRMCDERGINMQREVHTDRGVKVWENFRRIMSMLQVAMHAEYVSGHCWDRYATLDVYRSLHAMGMSVEDCKRVHFWVFHHHDPVRMFVPRADEWYTLGTWTCIGQQSDVFDWSVENVAVPRGMQSILDQFNIRGPDDIERMPFEMGQRVWRFILHVAPWMTRPMLRAVSDPTTVRAVSDNRPEGDDVPRSRQ